MSALTANLVLADGTSLAGRLHGAPRSVSGEVVFNTGMVGYTEALATATSDLDVHNARALIDWVDNAPGAAEQQAAMWTTSARRINEKILIAGEFAEALHDFAATQARQAERIREVGTIFRRAHAAELRRINEPKPGEDKWDISKNDPAGGAPSSTAPARPPGR